MAHTVAGPQSGKQEEPWASPVSAGLWGSGFPMSQAVGLFLHPVPLLSVCPAAKAF